VEKSLISHVEATHNSYPDGKLHYRHTTRAGNRNKCCKIRIIILSSTESRYVALCHCWSEFIFLRRLLIGLGFIQTSHSKIMEDNQSTIRQVYGNMKYSNSKHINPKFHFTREQRANGNVSVKCVNTKDNIAKLLTKPLTSNQTHYLSSLLLNSE